MKSTFRKRRFIAFTLIELLIVIAIIAILAAILFPVFARARENARRSSCQSNLKQIGIGLLQYIQDFDETLPRHAFGPSGDTATSNATNYKWMDAIFPYVKSEQIFNCPSDSNRSAYYQQQTGNYGSYGINAYGVLDHNPTYPNHTPPAGGNGSTTAFDVKASQLANAAGTYWVMENSNGYNGSAGPYGVPWRVGPSIGGSASDLYLADGTSATCGATPVPFPRLCSTPDAWRGGPGARHLETINILYCDGHVKASKILALKRTNGSGYLIDWTIEAD